MKKTRHSKRLKFALCAVFAFGVVVCQACGEKPAGGEFAASDKEIAAKVELKWAPSLFELPAGDVSEPVSEPEVEEERFMYWADIPLTYEEQEALFNAAEEFGVPYELAVAVVWRETNFTNVYGDNGAAYGYMQIWPSCHYNRMTELGVTDLTDPESNFRVGCHYLGELFEKYGDDYHKVLMAYNMGEYGARQNWAVGVTTSYYSETTLQWMSEVFLNGDVVY